MKLLAILDKTVLAMKITAHEEYGLRIIVRLAKILGTSDKDLVGISEIAEAEGISYENTAAIIGKLKDSDLVTSVRGKFGGYKLNKEPKAIKLHQIIDAFGEASFGIDFCDKHSGKEESCVNSGDCSIRPVWSAVNGLINNFLAGISLEDLLQNELVAHEIVQKQINTIGEIQTA
ncbi:MAG: Rrf2 family transcriptional regulator [Candidatus Melainabacteria bacterium]|nr:Rrf2 family transcriptional regulator [Candidatus Melainabacteria bacterium]